MIRGRHPEINGWGTYAELRERLNDSKVPRRITESFVRLVKDSIFDPRTGTYEFSSEYGYNTEPRLREIARHIGIVYLVEKEEGEQKETFYWVTTAKCGRDLLKKVSKLKTRQRLMPRLCSRPLKN